MSELLKQIERYIDLNPGYNKKQYYKMVSVQFGISQRHAKEYVLYLKDKTIGVGNE